MPDSDSGDEFNDEVQSISHPKLSISPSSSNTLNFSSTTQNFIVDIDSIQAHGIGAADITKLKANGFYTVAVSVSEHQTTNIS